MLREHDDYFDKMREEAEREGKVLRYVGVIDRVSGIVKCGLEKSVHDMLLVEPRIALTI